MAMNGWSSLAASVAAYQPYYAPPVNPSTDYIKGGAAGHFGLPPNAPNAPGHWEAPQAAKISHAPRRVGMRFLYSRGGQRRNWFKMIATGAVESTKFQPTSSWTWDGSFNDAIYQAGYPRNLGVSERVPSIPPAALGILGSQMAPRPQFKRNIFVNRTYGIQPGLPATPTNGMYS